MTYMVSHQHMVRVLCISVGLLFFAGSISAQQSDRLLTNVIPMPPNAASLAKFSDVPVSYYTGTPQVDIPIYTVQQGSLSVPISLSYHASGIRVDDRASWVGLGWSLNAGGSLSRSVRGLKDEGSDGFLSQGYKIEEDEYEESVAYLNQAAEGRIDTESDVYFINAPGVSGKFTMSFMGDILLKDFRDIQITRPIAGTTDTWSIVDENGVQYSFGKVTSTGTGGTDFSDFMDEYTGNSTFYISAWHLEKMISADKQDTITFFYSNEEISYNSFTPESVRIPDFVWNFTNNLHEVSGNTVQGCGASPPTYTMRTTTLVTVQQGLLQKIKFRNGSVVFVPSSRDRVDLPGSHSLDRIEIRDNEGALVKYFRLQHDKFVGIRADLKLNSVREFAADGDSLPPHAFGYNETIAMEPTSSFKQDHWGFLNSNPVEKMIPKNLLKRDGTYVYYKDGGDRDTDSTAVLASILTTITYPTGGRTEFEFEAHDASKVGRRDATEYYIEPIKVIASCVGNQCNGESITNTDDFVLDQPTPAKITIHCTCTAGPSGIEYSNGSAGISSSGFSLISGCGNPPNNQTLLERYVILQSGTYHLEAFGSDTGTGFSSSSILVELAKQRPVTSLGTHKVGGARIQAIREYDANDSVLRVSKYNYTYKPSDTASVRSSGVLISNPIYHYETTTKHMEAVPSGGVSIPVTITCKDQCGMSSPKNSLGDGTHIGYKQVTVSYGENAENGYTIYKYVAADEQPDMFGDYFPFAPSQSRDNRRGKLIDQTDFNSNGDTVRYTHFDYTIETTNRAAKSRSVKVGKLASLTNMTLQKSDFKWQQYFNYQEWQYVSKKTEISYSGLNRLRTETSFFYERPQNHVQMTRSDILLSDNSILRNKFKYPQDYTTGATGLSNIDVLKDRHIYSQIVEDQSWLVKQASASLISSKIIDFNSQYSRPAHIYLAEIKGIVQTLNNESTINSKYGGLISDTNLFKDRATFTYNSGRLVTQALSSDVAKTYIWGYLFSQPIAEIVNADPTDVAFTSFEDNSNGSWTIPGSRVTTAFTGRSGYNISTGNITRGGLSSSKKYRVVFWADNAATVLVNGKTPTLTANIGSWKKYDVVISSATMVAITGSGIIDEVRLCPIDAQMKTLTANPFIGPTSIADENGLPTFYAYDKFGRLNTIKDYEGNILKAHEYHYRNK